MLNTQQYHPQPAREELGGDFLDSPLVVRATKVTSPSPRLRRIVGWKQYEASPPISIQRPKTRLGLPIFTLATDRAPESCVVVVVMHSLRF